MKIKKISQSAGVVADVTSSLNSDSTVNALSAAAGKELDNKIDNLIIPSVEDSLTSNATDMALSANQGYILDRTKTNQLMRQKTLNTVGWYRVAKYEGSSAIARSFIVHINSVYSYAQNTSITLLINMVYNRVKIVNLSHIYQTNVVSKVRMVQENDDMYFEIYYNNSTQNNVFINFTDSYNTVSGGTKIQLLDYEAATSTATVLDELPITYFDTGIEYPTNEFLGTVQKRIWKKRISVGNLPNADRKNILHNLTNVTILDIQGYIMNSSGTTTQTIDGANAASISYYATESAIVIHTTGDWSDFSGYVTIYYVKN